MCGAFPSYSREHTKINNAFEALAIINDFNKAFIVIAFEGFSSSSEQINCPIFQNFENVSEDRQFILMNSKRYPDSEIWTHLHISTLQASRCCYPLFE